MTHKERLLTALQRGTPDQVPVTWELVDRASLALKPAEQAGELCAMHTGS